MSKYDHLIGMEIGSGEWSWDEDRAMLYAVGVGAGLDDPLKELNFTTENTPGIDLQVLPGFMTLMSAPGVWYEKLDLGYDTRYPIGLVHGEQAVTLARPLPATGTAKLKRILKGVYDKGSGALVVMETQMSLADTGEYLGSATMGLFCQGKGGFGGPRTRVDQDEWVRPDRKPDLTVSLPVGVNQSLIYRLLGDHNGHGTDPVKARADGFDRPVFYGLGTFGVACRALIRGLCDGDAASFGHIEGRFSKSVHPGDSLDMMIWKNDEGAQFLFLANGERLVLDRGVFRYVDVVKARLRAQGALG